VEGDQAVQFAALQHGPAPAGRLVHLVVALPGELDRRLPVPGRLAAVHARFDVAGLELTVLASLNSMEPEILELGQFPCHTDIDTL
jgi:hypothetical protein